MERDANCRIVAEGSSRAQDIGSEEHPRQSGFVFILGMHRSGTSCLAGGLEACGLYLGDVSRSSRFNAKGNREFKPATQLHNRILIASGGSWRDPPGHVSVSQEHKEALGKIARQLCEQVPCGLKDPRLLLLLDTWLELVDSFALVGTFRHPVAVAASLARRNVMPEEEACDLWLRHNAEIIRWHRRYRFPLIEFDLSDGEAYCQDVAAVATEMGLHPDTALLREFVTPEMDHYQYRHKPVPAICGEVFAYLRRHRYRPASSDGDQVRWWPGTRCTGERAGRRTGKLTDARARIPAAPPPELERGSVADWVPVRDNTTRQTRDVEKTLAAPSKLVKIRRKTLRKVKRRLWMARVRWRTLSGSLRLMPEFIIIGAMRGGTTSLYNYLARNPCIAGAGTGEVHFFDKYSDRGTNWYRAHFPLSLSRRVRRLLGSDLVPGEKSPYYVFHPRAPQRVAELLPDVKLIVLLRNPIDRAYSHYWHQIRRGYETLPFEEAIARETERLEGERERILSDPQYYSPVHQHYSYLSRGVYVDQIRAWRRVFPAEQMLILCSEQFYADPRATLSRVFAFLGVRHHDVERFREHNPGTYPQMNSQTRAGLAKYFYPHNERLYEYLGRRLDWDV